MLGPVCPGCAAPVNAEGGPPAAILDGDLNHPARLLFPSKHPEGAWLLVDLAMSHWPPLAAGQPARRRFSDHLRIFSGTCTDCPPAEFRRVSRPRRLRVELLQRAANRVDEDFIIPPAQPIWIGTVELEDRAGEQIISLRDAPPPPPAAAWPEQMQYRIAKLIVESVYPGERQPELVAIAELIYVDRSEEGALFEWQ